MTTARTISAMEFCRHCEDDDLPGFWDMVDELGDLNDEMQEKYYSGEMSETEYQSVLNELYDLTRDLGLFEIMAGTRQPPEPFPWS